MSLWLSCSTAGTQPGPDAECLTGTDRIVLKLSPLTSQGTATKFMKTSHSGIEPSLLYIANSEPPILTTGSMWRSKHNLMGIQLHNPSPGSVQTQEGTSGGICELLC